MKKSAHVILALLTASSLALAGCGSPGNGDRNGNETGDGGGDGDPGIEPVTELSMAWWGNDARHAAINAALDAFEEETGITVTREFSAFNDYWTRLAVQSAGGNMPDIVAMDISYVNDYGQRGAIIDLAEAGVDLSGIAEGVLDSGRVGDSAVAVPWGVNAVMMLADIEAIESSEVDAPDPTNWTWDDWEDWVIAHAESTPDGQYGAQDQNYHQYAFDSFLLQRGEQTFTLDGQLGFETQSLVDWWAMWDRLREANAIPDAETTWAEYSTREFESSVIATGNAPLMFTYTSYVPGIVNIAGDLELGFWDFPGEAQSSGQYVRTAQYLAISADSDRSDGAAQLVDFLINSEVAAGHLGYNIGVPSNASIRDVAAASATPVELAGADYVAGLEGRMSVTPVLPPEGGGQIRDLFRDIAQRVAYAQLTPQQGAEEFVTQAQTVLGG